MALNSPVREVDISVSYNGIETGTVNSYIEKTFTKNDNLKSFTVERVGDESKLFGYGIVQRLNIKLVNISQADAEAWFNTNGRFNIELGNLPTFYVSEVHRNEVSGELSITAYDTLKKATEYLIKQASAGVEDEEYKTNTLDAQTQRIINFLSVVGYTLPKVKTNIVTSSNYKYYQPQFTQWNLDGEETLRDVLDDIAEIYHSVYYISKEWDGEKLYFQPIYEPTQFNTNIDSSLRYVPITVGKEDYFSLETKGNREFRTLTHATALGENISSIEYNNWGTHVIIRDNSILSLMESDAAARHILREAGEYAEPDVGPNGESLNATLYPSLAYLKMNQFDCSWRGGSFVRIGRAIKFEDREGNLVTGYLLNDVIEYDGTMRERTQWNYKNEDAVTSSNPATLGEILKNTSAVVDKVNQNVTQVVHTQDEHEEQITTLVTEAGNISASVTTMQNGLEETLEGINGTFDTLTKKVEAAVTADDVQISIERELSNGVDKVSTKTGYTFDEEGLTIAKSNSEMSTQITDDGMTVYRSGEAVLIANNEGVQAEDLHATTYLIIGNNSRFEDMGSDRTACFWIGG